MDKKIELMKKLKALAEQGVGGEKETAQKKLEQLMKKYNVKEQELSDDAIEEHIFRFHGEFEKRLLIQVAYKVLGKEFVKRMYTYRWGKGKRTTRMIECTKAEALQIRIAHEFYCDLWKEEQDFFFECFIQKHRIFTADKEERIGEKNEMSKQDILRMNIAMMAMRDKSVTARIEG